MVRIVTDKRIGEKGKVFTIAQNIRRKCYVFDQEKRRSKENKDIVGGPYQDTSLPLE